MTGVLAKGEIVGRAMTEITARLVAAGVHSLSSRCIEQQGHIGIRFDFVGRDEAGHALATHCRFGVKQKDAREDEVARAIGIACRHHERLAERFGRMPPVEIGPDMPVDHLEVNAPLAYRLRHDHGDRARDVIRAAVVALAENGRRRGRARRDGPGALPVPHDMRLNTNRLDHSEEIAEGVAWRRHSIVMQRTTLPQVIVNGFTGVRASEVCDHPMLADERNTVSAISSVQTVTRHTKGTTVLSLVTPWIPVSQL